MLRVNAALIILDEKFFQSLMFELFYHLKSCVDSILKKNFILTQ